MFNFGIVECGVNDYRVPFVRVLYGRIRYTVWYGLNFWVVRADD